MKNIVFCADGTWNGMEVDEDKDRIPDATNVLKLFHLLKGDTSIDSRRLQDEAEKSLTKKDGTVEQIAKYLHGVGDTANPVMRLLGGAFGSGLIARIVRGYTFISRNWQRGDHIYLIGFGRGAYTARALAGMIGSVGLLNSSRLDLGDKELAYSLGVSAWRMYREKAKDSQTDRSIRERFAHFISGLPGYARIPLSDEDRVAASVHAVCVWDTVGALGIPVGKKDEGVVDPFKFTDDILSDNVTYGFHAVSIHEKRATFAPTLWKKRKDVKQILFSGAHSDVGGGYPEKESGLSNIALEWMYEEVRVIGLRVKDPFPSEWAREEQAAMHEPHMAGIISTMPPVSQEWRNIYVLEPHPSANIRMGRLQQPQYPVNYLP